MVTETFTNKHEIKNPSPHYNNFHNIICNIILSITKKTARKWKFGNVGDGSSSAHNCQLICFDL